MGTIKATAEVSLALRKATGTLTHVNESMSVTQIQQVVKEFSKQQGKMDIQQEFVYSPVSHYFNSTFLLDERRCRNGNG
jgi:division protein CdvB (Snf7/Vps24/ESCRT-III family)